MEPREQLNQAAVSAWEDYLATGCYVPAEVVYAWLAGWGTDNELPAPEPRCDW